MLLVELLPLPPELLLLELNLLLEMLLLELLLLLLDAELLLLIVLLLLKLLLLLELPPLLKLLLELDVMLLVECELPDAALAGGNLGQRLAGGNLGQRLLVVRGEHMPPGHGRRGGTSHNLVLCIKYLLVAHARYLKRTGRLGLGYGSR